jgi:hypothetical protein
MATRCAARSLRLRTMRDPSSGLLDSIVPRRGEEDLAE